jgi:hypothetical protein
MMDCSICHEHFSDLWADAHAAPAAARAHLEGCAACATDLAAFGDTVALLRRLPVVTPPPNLAGRIKLALDAAAPAPAPRLALWQPVTAGLSMAACLALVLWATVLNPVPSGGWDTVSAPINPATTYTAPMPTGMPGPAVNAPVPPQPSAPNASRPARPAGVRRFVSLRPGMANRGTAPQALNLGTWGEMIAQVPPAGGTYGGRDAHTTPPAVDPATGKPAGTFAAGDPVKPEAPLHRQGGAVQVAFTPPVEATVGLPVVGELTVTGEAEALIVLRVHAPPGLRLMRAPEGVVYRGPMRKGETLRVPVRLLAREAGAYKLRVQLDSDVPGVAADLEIILPGFSGAAGKNEPGPVSLRFDATPSLQALRDLAAAAGARVVLHEGLEPKLVTFDFSAGVPFAVALRVLCDDCGYRIEEREGVYHLLR